MDLLEQAAARVAVGERLGRKPTRWIVTEAMALQLGLNGHLHGLPVVRGDTRFGLELVCVRAE